MKLPTNTPNAQDSHPQGRRWPFLRPLKDEFGGVYRFIHEEDTQGSQPFKTSVGTNFVGRVE